MTLFLASVASAEEALTAVAAGADIVDAKSAESMGFAVLPQPKVRDVVAAVAGKRPVSAVAGDLPMTPEAIREGVGALLASGVDIVKVGFAPHPHRPDCIKALASFAQQVKIVGVLFADLDVEHELLPLMRAASFAGAMLDTFRKQSGRLLDHIDAAGLRQFIAACRSQQLLAGVAGSLESPDVPRLLLLEPDVLGLRGALCFDGDRRRGLDPARLELIRELIPLDRRSRGYAAKPAVDYRLLAARGYSLDDAKAAGATDRIFVHQLVLPVRIGAYARERAAAQRVRFNVDAHILRLDHAAEDMRDVVSYDLISDAIRVLVAEQPIALLETLAERIAALLLSRDRVVRVSVRLEKLDLGAGSVGVEIVRERSNAVAKVHALYPAAAEGDAKAAE